MTMVTLVINVCINNFIGDTRACGMKIGWGAVGDGGVKALMAFDVTKPHQHVHGHNGCPPAAFEDQAWIYD